MTDESKKKNGFLAAGLRQAVPPSVAPLPPHLRRGKSRETEQEEGTGKEQVRETASSRDQSSAETQSGEITDEQLRYLARLLQEATAKEREEKKAKQQKENVAELLIRALADTSFSDFRKIAETQQRKVTQGVNIPEALFTIYKGSANALTMKGKKITMGDLMAKALIKYLVEDILSELGKVEEE